MSHPNAATLQKIYACFAEGNLDGLLALCSEQVKFHVPGKTSLAGTYDRQTFGPKFVAQLMERSGGTLKVELHDILANDRHGTCLVSIKLTRGSKPVEYRAVHVWRLEGGKPVAWYDYPRDLYAYDAIWA